MGSQVGQAGRAEAAAPGALLHVLERRPVLADPAGDLVERQGGALAAGHGGGPGPRAGEGGAAFHGPIIVKLVFTFKPAPPTASPGLEWGMPEALDVTCPCCEALLK